MPRSSSPPSYSWQNIYGDTYKLDLRTIRQHAATFLSEHMDTGGLSDLAKAAKISRQTLWHLWSGASISERALFNVLNVLGLDLWSVVSLGEDEVESPATPGVSPGASHHP